MSIEVITAKELEALLRNLRKGNAIETKWLDLKILAQSGAQKQSPAALYDHLIHLGAELLSERRPSAQRRSPVLLLESSPQRMLEFLAADFQQGKLELEAVSAVYHRYLAPHLFSVEALAKASHVSTGKFRRRLDAGLAIFAEALQKAENRAILKARAQQLRRNLSITNPVQLFGIDRLLDETLPLFSDPNGPRLISLEGLGGIGKTTLAQAIALRLMESGQFNAEQVLEGIVWVNVRSEWLSEQGLLPVTDIPARSFNEVISHICEQIGRMDWSSLPVEEKLRRLQPLLNTTPYLIVIDNLETLAEIEILLPALIPLAGATRFLLTSRIDLHHYANVHIIQVPELGYAESKALFEMEAKRSEQSIPFTDEAFQQLFDLIGGLPLALKLSAAQTARVPLEHVLIGLRLARRITSPNRVSEVLYQFIYQRIWTFLNENGRQLLITMPLISPDGEPLDWIRSMSGLDDEKFADGLDQLFDFSLLEVSGSLEAPCYRVHRLTITFLKTNLLRRWK